MGLGRIEEKKILLDEKSMKKRKGEDVDKRPGAPRGGMRLVSSPGSSLHNNPCQCVFVCV